MCIRDRFHSAQRLAGQHLRVADDDHGVLGPGQRHVQAARVGQEPDALLLVGSHVRDDDVLEVEIF